MALADHFERHGVELLKQLMDEDPAKCCPCRELYPAILMMKSAEKRPRGEVTEPLDRPTVRRILVQRRMRSEFVVVDRVGTKDSTRVGAAEDYDVSVSFPTDRTDQPCCIPVLPGRPTSSWVIC